METYEEKSPEKEINQKNNNVVKFLQQYNKANFEITKLKKAINSSSQNKSNKIGQVRIKNTEKIYVENYGIRLTNNKTNLLIKLKDNLNSNKLSLKEKIGSPTANGVILPQIKINNFGNKDKDKDGEKDKYPSASLNSKTTCSLKSLMNNSNTNFHSNKLNDDLTPNNVETPNVCLIKKTSTGHSSSHSIHKNTGTNQKININNEPSTGAKAISIPKINLLKSTKSMSHMTFLSNNQKSNNNTINYDSNNNSQNKSSNFRSRKKSIANSSSKLKSVIDSQPASGGPFDNKNSPNYNNSFLNESSCEVVSSRGKDKKNPNLESINSNNDLELQRENFSSNIDIRENLILEKPQNQEDEEDEIYDNGFDNIDRSNILNENKNTIDVSINNFNSIIVKEKPENSYSYGREKANEKGNDNNNVSLKDKKTLNSNKDNNSGLYLRKNRIRGFNSTFAKSMSPSKLTIQGGKLISEFNSIKEVEENKMNSPDPKASSAVKNLVSFNNQSKMNLFCINKEKFFLYLINPGNNSELVRKCMAHRINWKEVSPNAQNYFNFKWQHTSTGLDYSSLSKNGSIKQIVNHFEYHSSISNKLNLFINLMKYCEKKNLEVFKIIPFTVIIQYDSPSFAGQLDALENFYDNIPNYTGTWKTPDDFELNENIMKYANIFKLGILNDKLGYRTSAYIEESHYDGKNLWIVKAPDLNRGRCIKIADSMDAIKKIIKQFYEGIFRDFKNSYEEENKNNKDSDGSPVLQPGNERVREGGHKEKKEKKFDNDFRKYRANSVIIQKYIEKPLLYWGRKFDVRMWVMITHKLDVYCYKEGHLKTSSIPYDLHSADSYVHLTNYSVQKYNKEFSKFEQGNEVSFIDFQNFLDKEYGQGVVSVTEHIYPKILDLIKIVAFCAKDKINSNDRKYSFEIFGFDFLIDKNFDVYVLEVNTNPGLEESSNLIKMLLPRMMDDALKLTIDDIFDTKYSNEVDILSDKNNLYSPYSVEGYSDRDNLWDFVINMKDDVN